MRLVKVLYVPLQHMHAASFSQSLNPVLMWFWLGPQVQAAPRGERRNPFSLFLSFSPSTAPLTFPSASSAPLQLQPLSSSMKNDGPTWLQDVGAASWVGKLQRVLSLLKSEKRNRKRGQFLCRVYLCVCSVNNETCRFLSAPHPTLDIHPCRRWLPAICVCAVFVLLLRFEVSGPVAQPGAF